MQTEDSDSIQGRNRNPEIPTVGALRLITLHEPEMPQRRRTPRRRMVAAFLIERRRADRRGAKPGIDGLLRVVLADDWK